MALAQQDQGKQGLVAFDPVCLSGLAVKVVGRHLEVGKVSLEELTFNSRPNGLCLPFKSFPIQADDGWPLRPATWVATYAFGKPFGVPFGEAALVIPPVIAAVVLNGLLSFCHCQASL